MLDRGTLRPQTLSELDTGTGDGVGILIVGSVAYVSSVVNGARIGSLLFSLSAGTTYWTTLTYDSAANTFTVDIFSDADRLNLLASTGIAHNVTSDKQYIAGVSHFGTIGFGAVTMGELDLGAVPTVTPIPPHVFQRVR